jgi:hypothetical protein
MATHDLNAFFHRLTRSMAADTLKVHADPQLIERMQPANWDGAAVRCGGAWKRRVRHWAPA